MTLVWAVDGAGIFDGLTSCVEGGSGMLGEDPRASVPDGAVGMVSGKFSQT